jgi:hypothetical protein
MSHSSPAVIVLLLDSRRKSGAARLLTRAAVERNAHRADAQTQKLETEQKR